MSFWKRKGLAKGRRGGTLVEVGLLVGLVAVVAISAVSGVGTKVTAIFSGTSNAMDSSFSAGGIGLAGGAAAPSNASPILSVSPTQAQVGSAYSYQVSASDADGDALTFSLSGSLPAGLSMISSGLVSGTPTGTGGSATVTVSDGRGGTTSAALSVPVNSLPTVTFAPPTGIVGDAYSYQVPGSDPDGDAVTFSLSGSLPAGLSMSSSGLISGTPTAAGGPSATVSVSDGRGGSASASATVWADANITDVSYLIQSGSWSGQPATFAFNHANAGSDVWVSSHQGAAVADNAWIGQNFPTAKTLSRVRLYLIGAGAVPASDRLVPSADLEYSSNGSTWSRALSMSLPYVDGPRSFDLPSPISAKYWRVRARSGTTNYGWHLYEVELYGH